MPNLTVFLQSLGRYSRRLLALLILASAIAIASPTRLTLRRKYSALSPLGVMLCARLTDLLPRLNLSTYRGVHRESRIKVTLKFLAQTPACGVNRLKWAVIAVFWALLTIQSVKAETTTTRSLSKMDKKYDGILSALASIQGTLAGLGYLRNQELQQNRKLNSHLVEQLRVLRSWNSIMVKLDLFTKDGDHDIVLEGSPGVTLYGTFKSNRMYLTCIGHLPTFCEMRAHKAVMKVKRTTEGFKPLRAGRW